MDQKTKSRLTPCCVRMLKELKGCRGRIALACFLLLISSLLGLAGSFILGQFTDNVLSGGQGTLFWLLLAVLALSLLAGTVNQYYWGRLHQTIGFSLRKRLAEKLNAMDYPWFEAQRAGDLITRLNADTEQTLGMYAQLKTIGMSFFLGLLSLTAIVFISPWLAIAHLLFPIISQMIIYFSSKKMDPLFRKRQQLMGEAASCSQEALDGLLEIKAMSCEDSIFSRYKEKVKAFISHMIRLERPCTLTDTALDLLAKLQSVLLVAFGGLLVFWGKISMGDLLAAQLLSGNISKAVSSLNFFQLRMNMASVLRLFAIFDGEETKAKHPSGAGPLVSMEKVSFSYPQRREVSALDSVNFSVNPGERVAIVGESGSGKSSMLKLIAGFYPPDQGKLLQNEENWAMISQDTFLFADTYYQNIACGNLSADEKKVKRAAEQAKLTEFISSAPKGFQTLCREQGKDLSGGQRQRFSIARCLCRDPKLLLLDEPTAALDPATEQAVMDNILTLFQGKTLVLVTHNLGLAAGFDRIYVMKDGKVAESGSHETLLNRQGLYCQLLREGKR